MTGNLTHLVYVSDAQGAMTQDMLEDIVRKSARKNRQLDITGVLLYDNRHFMQLLEGDLHVINELYQTITQDERHTRVLRLAFYPVAHRQFPDWSMELINLEDTRTVDRSRLREMLDQHANTSIHEVQHFSQITYDLLDEFRRQLMPDMNENGMLAVAGRSGSEA